MQLPATWLNATLALNMSDLEREGFAILPILLSIEAVRFVKHSIVDVPQDMYFYTDVHLRIDWVASLATSVELALASLVPDSEWHVFQAQFRNTKDEAAVPWHQDGMQSIGKISPSQGEQRTEITFWVAIDETSPELSNGPLEVQTRLHKNGYLMDETLGGYLNEQILIENVLSTAGSKLIAYDLPGGGAGVHLPFTPHRSGLNTCSRHRRVIVLRFASIFQSSTCKTA